MAALHFAADVNWGAQMWVGTTHMKSFKQVDIVLGQV